MRKPSPKISSISSRLLKRFESAAIEKSWMGGKHPDAHDQIEEEYEAALTMLKRRIEKLETHQAPRGTPSLVFAAPPKSSPYA